MIEKQIPPAAEKSNLGRHFGDVQHAARHILLPGSMRTLGDDPFGGHKVNGRTNGSVNRIFDPSMPLAFLQLTGELGGREEITRPYEENPWVHAALKVLCEAVSSTRLQVFETNAEDARPVPDDSEFVRLFNRPNVQMSFAVFMSAGLVNRKLDGEDFWFLTDAAGNQISKGAIPAQLWPVRGSLVDVEEDRNGIPTKWSYRTANGSKRIFDAYATLFLRDYSPSSYLRGLGDVEVLARQLELQFQAERYQAALLKNSGDPGGFIKYSARIQAPEKARLEAEARDAFSPASAGAWKILDEDADYTPNKLSPKDMEYRQLLVHARDVILSVLGVPPPMVGVFEAATYNNITEARRLLWTGGNGVISYLRTVEDHLNAHFFPELSDARARRYVARFDLASIDALQLDGSEKIKIAEQLVKAGIGLSMHEATRMLGLRVEPSDHFDVHFLSPQIVAVDGELKGVIPTEGATADEAEDDNTGSRPDEDGEPRKPQDDPAEQSVGRLERKRWWQDFERAYLLPNDARIFKAAKRWLRNYQQAQLRRIESVAKHAEGKGYTARRMPPPEFWQRDVSVQDILQVLLLDRDEWQGKMSKLLGPQLATAFKQGLQQAQTDLGGTSVPFTSDELQAVLKRQVIFVSEGVNSTVARKVKSAMIDVLRESDPADLNSLQQAIREALPELKGSLKRAFGNLDQRAWTIARTESGKAANTVRYMHMRANDTDAHEWVSQQDSDVRHSHEQVDGEIVSVGKRFSNGLLYPLDPAGDAGEVINCRCGTRPA